MGLQLDRTFNATNRVISLSKDRGDTTKIFTLPLYCFTAQRSFTQERSSEECIWVLAVALPAFL